MTNTLNRVLILALLGLLGLLTSCGSSDSGGGGPSTSTGGGGNGGFVGSGGASIGGSGGVIVGATGGFGNSPTGGTGNVGTGGVQLGAGGTTTSTGGTPSTGGTTSAGGVGGTGTGGTGGAAPGALCAGMSGTECKGESCCTSPLVTGGTFYRSYDGVTFMDQSYPATVSNFRLDKFEITVGRFRKFKAAWDIGWRPSAGAGRHTHLNAGSGLMDSSGTATTTYEQGWDAAWTSSVAPTDTNLSCDSTHHTWTPSAGASETRPINCITWYEAAAFCIWDEGFLPSEAEWNYAASGGAEHRVYPWSSPATSTTIDCMHANYYNGTTHCVSPPNGEANDVGSESPTGNSKYGQADLAGNVWEWNLDSYNKYANACTDCANTTPASSISGRVLRGGGFNTGASNLLSSYRFNNDPMVRSSGMGARCARSP